mmetsp:Transcript_66258/g.176422  ORF Transcript_66258/g.176422 Transcript_66258/m.176422 type:complete len:236 (-) Transcript_66258:134-841(-)
MLRSSASKTMPRACNRSRSAPPHALAGVRKPPAAARGGSEGRSRASSRPVSASILAVSSYPGSPPDTLPTSLRPAGAPLASATSRKRNHEAARCSAVGPSPCFGSRPRSTSSRRLAAGAAFARATLAATSSLGASAHSRYVKSALKGEAPPPPSSSSPTVRRTIRVLIVAMPKGATHEPTPSSNAAAPTSASSGRAPPVRAPPSKKGSASRLPCVSSPRMPLATVPPEKPPCSAA